MFLANLFAKNPFTSLKTHMNKSLECVEETKVLFAALEKQDHKAVLESAKNISTLEHEADVIKHEIRSQLTSSVFLPVDRRDVLSLLAKLDAIADLSEDIGVLLTMRQMDLPAPLWAEFRNFYNSIYPVVDLAADVIASLDGLLESGFSGPNVESVLAMVDEVGRLEHEADKMQDIFGKGLFHYEDDMKPAALYMWIKIANKVGDIANAAEGMANKLRIMLAPR